MQMKRLLMVLTSIFLLAFLVTGCSSSNKSAPNTQQPAQAKKAEAPVDKPAAEKPVAEKPKELEKLVIHTPSVSLSYFPMVVAIEKGFFKEEGFNVELIQAKSNAGLAALTSGDVAYSTAYGSSVNAIAQGMPLKVLMVISDKPQHVIMSKGTITKPEDLKGKVFAFDGVGSTTQREMIAYLKYYKMTEADVKGIALGTSNERTAALQSGQIDATIIAVPFDFALEKQGFNRLGNLAEIMDIPLSGVSSTIDRLAKKPDEAVKVLRAILKGVAYTKANKNEIVPLIKNFAGLEDLEIASKAYDQVRNTWSDTGIASQEALENSLEGDTKVDFSKIVDWSYAKKAAETLKK